MSQPQFEHSIIRRLANQIAQLSLDVATAEAHLEAERAKVKELTDRLSPPDTFSRPAPEGIDVDSTEVPVSD